MKNKTYITLALGAVIATTGVAGVASAEEAKTLRPFTEFRQEYRGQLKDAHQAEQKVRDNVKAVRTRVQAVRAEQVDKMKTFRAETKDTLQTQRTNIKERLDAATTDKERAIIMKEALRGRAETKGTIREERSDVRQENKNLRGNMRENVKERFTTYLAHINTRLASALTRFNKLGERIQDYLDKKEDGGTDVDEAQRALNSAMDAGEVASAKVDDVKDLVERILASDTPKDGLSELRTAIKEATSAIREANKAMKTAIRAARAME